MTRIIVEGPDGAGKTSLISRLREHNPSLDLAPRACTSDDGPITTLREWVEADLDRGIPGPFSDGTWDEGKLHLYDRHPLISEPIYGPLVRGYIDPGLSDRTWLGSAYQKFFLHRPRIIICLPPYAIVDVNIRKAHKATTQHLRGVLNNAMGIYDSYAVLAAKQSERPLTVVWDYTQPKNLDKVLAMVED